MDRFKLIKEIGDGSFGSVFKAINEQTGEVVAIKKMKKLYYSWEECMNLREVKSLRKMNHPNIMKLKEVVRENDILYFVFEYMEQNLYQLMKSQSKVFSVTKVRNWCLQIFQALAYMHQHGYFHRDMKPENLLVTKDIIKVADFGLAREISSRPPFTEYVSTRWYRAPEIILQSSVYDSAVDMWAMGAIMAELFTLQPLFPGSSETDEIYKICSVIGSPDDNSWSEGLQFANAINFHFPQLAGAHLSALIPSASEDAIHLISSLCSWDPRKRPTAAEALRHAFFQPCFYIPPSLRAREIAVSKTPTLGSLEQKNFRRYSTGPLSITKSSSNFSSTKRNTSLYPVMRRKVENDYQERPQKNANPAKNYLHPNQTRLRAPARISPVEPALSGRNTWRVVDTADKFSQIALNTEPSQAMKQASPSTMKAGGLHGRFYVIPPARGLYTRKVNG